MNLYEFGLRYLLNNSPSYKIADPEIGIVTATDSNTFIGVKTLFASIKNKINFICYDIGLTNKEVEWCNANDLTLIPFPVTIPFIDKWQTYLKPFIIEASPYPYTIWIDSDCVVVGDLSTSQLIANKETFFTKHWINIKYLKHNNEKLYELYPVQCISEPINAGVFGINKTTDSDILKEWLFMTKNTIDNSVLRNYVINWDEGSLIWAINKTNNGKKIVSENSKYNFFCEVNEAAKIFVKCYKDFYDTSFGDLKNCGLPSSFFKELLNQDAYVCHLSTCMENGRKYWKKWI